MTEMDFNKIRIDFVVRTGSTPPDDITSIIGLKPTHVSYKGVPRPQGGTPRLNLWVLGAPEVPLNDTALKAQWDALVELLEPKSKEIRNLKHEMVVEVIVINLNSFEDIAIPSSMIDFCYKIGAEIKIVPYNMSE